MKAYILSEADFDSLLTSLDRDPQRGHKGGSSFMLTEVERKAHDTAHRFYNYQVRNWIDKVKS